MKKTMLFAVMFIALAVTNVAGASRTSTPALLTNDDEIHYTVISPTQITIDWRGSSSIVYYDVTSSYGKSIAAIAPSHPPYSSAGPFREAKLTGLQPNTTYHYSIGGGMDHTFRTPLSKGEYGFTVDAIGDVGDSASYSRVAPVQSMIATDHPALALIVGDLTYGNPNGQSHVDQHFNDVQVWSQNGTAYMPAWGNHEWDASSDNLNNYKGRFDFPNPQTSPGSPSVSCCGEDWYWFDYGNTRFIAYPEPFSGAWSDWNTKARTLMDAAQIDPSITFIVTFGHRPAYSTGYHNGDSTLAGYMNNLGATHNKYVLNINGHSHNYERTYPQSGVIHITAGTGGSALEQVGSCLWSVCTQPSWSAKRYMRMGVLKLEFNANNIQGSFVCGPAGGGTNDIACTTGQVIDTFTITGGNPVTPTPTLTRTPTPTLTYAPSPTPTFTFTEARHYTANETRADGSSAYTDAAAIGFNIHDTGMSASTINALPAGSQAIAYVGLGSSNCSATLSSTFTSFVLANATNPKLFGFYLTDEPLNDTCVGAVTAYTNYIHTNAPGKKAFIVLTDWPGTYAAYRPSVTNVDLIGLDPYPVKGGTYDTALIPNEISSAMAAGIPLANIVPVFQTFGGAGWDAPTATQLTAMLGQWATLVPNPPLDYAYSWGTQSNSLSDALVNRADWRDIMAAHNHAQNPNVTPTPTSRYTISGNAGVAGVTLSYTDGIAKTATSAADGNYSLNVSSNWSGTVIPSKACYTFNPLNRSYSSVTNNQTAENFTPSVVSGCATGSGTYDDPHSGWTYTGTWIPYTGLSGPYGGTKHSTSDLTATASFTFSGTGFVLYYITNTGRGNIQVWVDGAQIATINANGTLHFQSTYTSPTLSAGIHTVVFKHGGPSGAYIDMDAIQILAKYDDTDSNWAYSGSWTPYTGLSGPYAGTKHSTSDLTATASFPFTGSGFVFYYITNSGRGSIQVWVDGSQIATINANGTLQYQSAYTSPTLSAGSHTAVFKNVGPSGMYIDVDAIQILGGSAGGTPDTTPPSAISNLAATTSATTNGSVNLSWTAPGNDGTVGTASSYLVRYSLAQITNETQWSSATPVSAGIPTPAVSGTAQGMTVSGLTAGTTYYFAVRAQDAAANLGALSNSPSAVASTITTPPPPASSGPGMYDDANSGWTYTGSWIPYTGLSGPYGGTKHSTSDLTATASFTFSGTGFAFYYITNTGRGNIQVWVDGSQIATINANGTLHFQSTYTSPTFPLGTHTVVFKHGGPSGTYIDVDAIQIFAMYDDTASNWAYAGSWAPYTGLTGPYGGTKHSASDLTATASFPFTGSGFVFYYITNSGRGNIQVWVDGVQIATINANDTLQFQSTYSSPALTAGAHTVVFKHAGPSGTYIDVDAITIR